MTIVAAIIEPFVHKSGRRHNPPQHQNTHTLSIEPPPPYDYGVRDPSWARQLLADLSLLTPSDRDTVSYPPQVNLLLPLDRPAASNVSEIARHECLLRLALTNTIRISYQISHIPEEA